jgi:hypothetical protein
LAELARPFFIVTRSTFLRKSFTLRLDVLAT